jgi:hypothetical protein
LCLGSGLHNGYVSCSRNDICLADKSNLIVRLDNAAVLNGRLELCEFLFLERDEGDVVRYLFWDGINC